MKRFLLCLAILLIVKLNVKAQQGHIFGVLYYDPGTCTVQVDYWISNPTSGNGSFQLAITKVNIQWDQSLFDLVSFTSYTENLNKTPDHWMGDPSDPAAPDTEYYGSRNVTAATYDHTDTSYNYDTTYNISSIDTTYSPDSSIASIDTTFTISSIDTIYNPDSTIASIDTTYSISSIDTTYNYFNSISSIDTSYVINTIDSTQVLDSVYTYSNHTYSTLLIQRSTDSCNNLFTVAPGESKPVASIKLHFKNCSSAYGYDYTDPNAPNFIGDFANSSDTIDINKKILFVLGPEARPYDPSGTNCKPGTEIKSLNNIPVGDGDAQFTQDQIPLPLKLVSFNANKVRGNAILEWKTAQELRNKGFEIQRKTRDGYETIGFVFSKSSTGNSATGFTYQFEDQQALSSGVTYYRLKIVNLDEKFVYSDIRALNNNSRLTRISVYPNPNKGFAKVIIPEESGTMDAYLSDYLGRIVRKWTGLPVQNMELSNLGQGIYILKIYLRETGENLMQKIIVEK